MIASADNAVVIKNIHFNKYKLQSDDTKFIGHKAPISDVIYLDDQNKIASAS